MTTTSAGCETGPCTKRRRRIPAGQMLLVTRSCSEKAAFTSTPTCPRRGFDAAGYPRCGLVVCRERPGMVAPGMFAAPAGHPVPGTRSTPSAGQWRCTKVLARCRCPAQSSSPASAAVDCGWRQWRDRGGPRPLLSVLVRQARTGAGPWSPQVIAVHHWGRHAMGLYTSDLQLPMAPCLAQWRSRAARIRTVGPARSGTGSRKLAWALRSFCRSATAWCWCEIAEGARASSTSRILSRWRVWRRGMKALADRPLCAGTCQVQMSSWQPGTHAMMRC